MGGLNPDCEEGNSFSLNRALTFKGKLIYLIRRGATYRQMVMRRCIYVFQSLHSGLKKVSCNQAADMGDTVTKAFNYNGESILLCVNLDALKIKLLCVVFSKILSIFSEEQQRYYLPSLRTTNLEEWWFQETRKENQSSYPRLNSNCTNTRANDKQTSYLQVLREENEESSLSLTPQEIVNICYSCV